MSLEEKKVVLNSCILKYHLRFSKQREEILEILYQTGKHQSAEELHRLISEKYPGVGIATVYRSLRLFTRCGICNELHLEDGKVRYELRDEKEHHDHMICLKCGKLIEISSPEIEKLQDDIAGKYGFTLIRHRLELYGICKDCGSGDLA